MRTINYFQARDEAHRTFLTGSDMPAPTRAIFLYLLSCTLYAGEAYGWVRHSSCGVATIAAVTGYSERSVKSHLQLLERNGLVRRQQRPRTHRGRPADEIRIEWSYLYQGAAPARETDAPGVADQGAGAAPSFLYKEKELQEPGQAREADVIELRRRSHV